MFHKIQLRVKIAPQYKGKYINYRLLLLTKMELLNIVKLNIKLLTFANFVEFLKSSKVKVGLNIFFLFSSLKIC